MYDGSSVATPPSGDNRGWLARGTARRCWLARRHCKTTLADTSLAQFLTCVCRHGWRSGGGAMRGGTAGQSNAMGVYCGSRGGLSCGIHVRLSFIY